MFAALRFGALMLIGLGVGSVTFLLDPSTAGFGTPSLAALGGFPFDSFGGGVAVGLVLGFIATRDWRGFARRIVHAMRRIGARLPMALLGAGCFAVLVYG
ncbi:MAG: hypothetical protein ACFCUN_08710 [Hyphomicrobiaceae bacterium]